MCRKKISDIENMTKRKLLITLVFLVFSVFSVNGQTPKTSEEELKMSSFNLMEDFMIQLIPLDDIIDIGVEYSPNIKRNAFQADAEKERVTIQKKLWSNHIQVFSNYSFGNQGILIAGSTDSNINSISNGYRFGVNASIPLYEFYTRPNRIKLAKAELASAENLQESIELEVKQQIINYYFRLIATQKSMINNNEFLQKAIVSEKVGELKFKENQISLTDYTRLSEISTLARERYNNAYTEFLTSYKELEVILGVELHLLKR
jgi:outer membrane protein TolC